MTSLAFYGSSLLSSYWNGAATYYRGMLKALAGLGWDISFYEPDILARQEHRDIDLPGWCRVAVWQADARGLADATAQAAAADIVVVASGIGYGDDAVRRKVLDNARPGGIRIWWDVDAPATLTGLQANPDHPLRRDLARFDIVLTYGGGDPVVTAYRELGARACEPVYNALDPETHFPVARDPRFAADLAFLANRLPDREARVAEFFGKPAAGMPERRFLIGGSGWNRGDFPENVRVVGHVGTGLHNAFNVTPRAVLNVARDSMAAVGFSPATRVFEAAGAGACLITDAWEGIELFLQPGREVLVARDGLDVEEILGSLSLAKAQAIGTAARSRILAEHTYAIRAEQVAGILSSLAAKEAAQ